MPHQEEKTTELDKEFQEAPNEAISEEEPMEKEGGLSVSLKDHPEFKGVRVGEIIPARLKVTSISEDEVCFDVLDFQKKKKKSRKEIETDSQGSYKVRY